MPATTTTPKRKPRAKKAAKTTTAKRVGRRPVLLAEPDTVSLLTNAIAAGAFDHAAAEAAGIHPGTFRRWMARGEEALALEANGDPVPDDLEPYRALCAQVRTARAGARVRAENRVFTENPLAWLRYGPGRHKGDQEGWTAALHAEVEHSGEVHHEVIVVYEGDDWADHDPDDDDGDGGDGDA